MFDIQQGPAGEVVMTGRLDATQCDAALAFLNGLPEARVIDLARLEYVASAGLRIFLLTQKRLKAAGSHLRLVNVSAHVYSVFQYAGFDRILDISRAEG